MCLDVAKLISKLKYVMSDKPNSTTSLMVMKHRVNLKCTIVHTWYKMPIFVISNKKVMNKGMSKFE